MTRTLTLSGDLHRDIGLLASEMDKMEHQLLLQDFVRLEPALLTLGVMKLQWEIGSEYDDGTQYFDVIDGVQAFDQHGDNVDLYQAFEDFGLINPLNGVGNYEIYDALNETLGEYIAFLNRNDFALYHVLKREVS